MRLDLKFSRRSSDSSNAPILIFSDDNIHSSQILLLLGGVISDGPSSDIITLALCDLNVSHALIAHGYPVLLPPKSINLTFLIS